MVVTTQPANCQNDGQVQVTVVGPDIASLDMVNAEYSIQAVNTTFQTPFARWTDGIYSGISPGTYVVKMRVYCSLSGKWETRTSASNIIIAGNYAPLDAFTVDVYRKPLNCAPKLGILRVLVDGGRAPYVIRFTSKPASCNIDSILLDYDGAYYLIDSITPGSYTLTVTDACDYTITKNITTVMATSEDVPSANSLSNLITSLQPSTNLSNTGCNIFTYSVYASFSSSSHDLTPYWTNNRSQFYEVSFRVNGVQTPWQTIGTAVTFPNSNSYYQNNMTTITCTVRLKESLLDPSCPQPPSRSSSISINSPTAYMNAYDAGICNFARVYFYAYYICYPYTWTLTTSDPNNILASGTAYNSNSQYPSIQLPRGTQYTLHYTDISGLARSTSITPSANPGQTFSHISSSQYTYGYPYYSPTIPLGSSYMYIYVSPNNGFPIAAGTTIEYVSGPANSLDPFFGGPGSIYTIPVGYNQSSFYPWGKNAYGENYQYILPGTYVFEVTNVCGTKTRLSWTRGSIYTQQQDDFTYTTQETCDGITISPSGYFNVLNANASITQVAANFHVWGPLSGDCLSGGSITLGRKGVYSIGMWDITGYSYNHYYNTNQYLYPKTFTYSATNIVIDADSNMAYACSSTDDAYIKIQAKNGIPPYTYEILGSNLPPNQTGEFEYGHGGEIHLIKITDDCGKASFIIPMPILDLTTASVAYAYNNGIVCEGGELGINCVNLGDGATYLWTGPNNFSSSERMPRISPATTAMTGWYYITVTPEYCSTSISDSVYVEVNPAPPLPVVTEDTVLLCYPVTSQMLTSVFDTVSVSEMPLRWYDQWGNYIAAPEQTSIPNQTGTYNYYISYGYGGSCEGNKLPLTLRIEESRNLSISSITAFICEDGSGTVVRATASGGVQPYTYEITGSGLPPNHTGEFAYGQAGMTYQMKVTDHCGVMVTDSFTVISNILIDDDTLHECMDGSVVISCADVGNVNYVWTGPDNFVAYTRQVVIPSADALKQGWYKVRVTPEGCDNEITDSIYLELHSQSSLPVIANDTLYYCRYHYQNGTIVYDTVHILTDAGITASSPLKWYSSASSNIPLAYDMDNYPAVSLWETTTFYISQGYSISCESERVTLTVIVRTGTHEIDNEQSYAYICAGMNAANIHIAAKNGIPPYTYEIQGSGLPANTTGNFTYGQPGQTYTVIIYDACGVAKSADITVNEISTNNIINPKPIYYCVNDDIILKTVNMGDGATYSWTGPAHFSSTLASPVIEYARPSHEGFYYLTVTLAECGTLYDTVEVILISDPQPPTVTRTSINLCITNNHWILLDTLAGVSASYALHWYDASFVEISPLIDANMLPRGRTLTYYVSQGASNPYGCQSSLVAINITNITGEVVDGSYFFNYFLYCPNEIPEPIGFIGMPYIYKTNSTEIDSTAVFTYQWQYYNGELDEYSSNEIASNWIDIPGATSDSLFFTQPLTQGLWYRRLVYANGLYSCGSNLEGSTSILKIFIGLKTPLAPVPSFNIQPNAQGVVFVKDYAGHGWNVPTNADGSSWAKAYPGLADPLYKAYADEYCTGNNTNIKEIHVAAGVYYPQYVINENPDASANTDPRSRAFVLVKGVKIYGGFPASATDGVDYIDHLSGTDTRNLSDPNNKTVLSGDIGTANNVSDNVYNIVISMGIPHYDTETVLLRNATLDGFTITGGNANNESFANTSEMNFIHNFPVIPFVGSGIYNILSYPTLKNLTVTENSALMGGGMIVLGGGMERSDNVTRQTMVSVDSIPFILTNINITKNSATSEYGNGGGLYLTNANALLQNCNISENTANYSGGGIESYSSVVKLTDVIISKNKVLGENAMGGGIYSSAGRLEMLNVRITNNESAGDGGGIYNTAALYYIFPEQYRKFYDITNVTIADNTAVNYGGGMYSNVDLSRDISGYENQGRITNSIFWDNSAGEEGNDIYQWSEIRPIISYSIVNGCFEGSSCSDSDPSSAIGINGGYNKTANPLFNDPANDDYSLADCSPAINAGDNTAPLLIGILYDLAGNTRIVNGRVDMGAYEYESEAGGSGIFYVDHTATGNNDGTSWSNAFTSFAEAVKMAGCGSNISHILVAQGVYHPEYDHLYNTYANSADSGATGRTFLFTNVLNGVKVLGGYENALPDDNSPEQNYYITAYTRDYLAYPSILSGDFDENDGVDADNLPLVSGRNAGHVIITVNTDTTLLFDGLIITGGNAAYSEAIYQIEGNYINNYSGGGVYNCESSPSFNNVVITHNSANSTGGGVFNTSLTLTGNGLTPIFTHSLFVKNRAYNGGGAYNDYVNAVYKNTRFTENYAINTGGAVFNGGASAIFINVLMDNNRAGEYGSAVTNNGGSSSAATRPLFINNTITDNTTDNNRGAAFHNASPAQATINNTIIWGNVANNFYPVNGNGISFTTTLIEGLNIGGYNGNLLANAPVFNTDYSLGTAGFGINRGDDNAYTDISFTSLEDLDIAGNARFSGTIDLGAFELTTVIAENDTVHLFKNSSDNEIHILDNDDYSCEYPTLTLYHAPDRGTAEVNSGIIIYEPNAGYLGRDSVAYILFCGTVSDTAWLHIFVEDIYLENNAICIGDNTNLYPATDVTWQSADLTVATVTNDGLVTGLAEGTTYFTVTNADHFSAFSPPISVVKCNNEIFISCDDMPYIINTLDFVELPNNCGTPSLYIITQPANGPTSISGTDITYYGTTSGSDSLAFRVICGDFTSNVKVTLHIDASGSAFVDDVWYFGKNAVTPNASPGIRFIKNSLGEYIPQDVSGIAKVHSEGRSLVVSSPYCNEVVFYANCNQLYNGLHDTIQNGLFEGTDAMYDGMAACYMGDNKYLFFSTTAAYDSPTGLKAYVIDMNANNGRGARIKEIVIEQNHNNMNPSIELIARAGTSDQYWLIYAHCQNNCAASHTNELRTRLVDVSNPDNPQIGNILFQTPKTSNPAFTMKVSHQNNRLAVANCWNSIVDLYDFDNSTGILSNPQTVPVQYAAAGIEFSPDGKQLYASSGRDNVSVFQYDISVTPPLQIGTVQYWTQTSQRYKGGGLKLGPDGKIYVVQAYVNQVGVISNPNSTTSLTARYNISAFTLSVTPSLMLEFSTAITNPAIISCNTNNPPVAQADSTSLCVSTTSRTIKINVLLNDSDIDPNDTIYLTSASFLNKTDTALATLTVNPVDSTITLNLKSSANIGASHVFDIIYRIKDDGLPISQCATGSLKIKAYPIATANDITAKDTTICYSTTATIIPDASHITSPEFHWYSSQIATTPFHTGADYTTSQLTADSAFYIGVSGDSYCENDTSNRKAVTVSLYAPLNGGTIGNSQPYCFGIMPLSIVLGEQPATGGSGNYIYHWESSTDGNTFATFGNSTSDYPINSQLTQTTYYYRTVTDAVCGTVAYSDTIQITINPLPTISSSMTTMCPGMTAQLTPDTGGFWTSDDSSVVDIINSKTIVSKSTGSATLTYKDTATNCTSDISITVNPYPDPAEITGKTVVCIGDQIQLSNATTGGTWTHNNSNISLDDPAANPVTVTGISEGKSFVTYTVVSDGVCETKRTFKLKIVQTLTPPRIIIGIERK
jgi:hypothetical protein